MTTPPQPPRPQLYRLTRSVTITGTEKELNTYEHILPLGTHRGPGDAITTVSNVGVRQLVTDAKVPEPPQVPEIPSTTKKGTT